MKNFISFHLSETIDFTIELPCEKSMVYRYDEITVTLHNKKDKFILYSDDFIIEAIVRLYNALQKILNNERILDDKLNFEDIGLWYNKYLHSIDEGNNAEEELNLQYLLWDTHSRIGTTTWMYRLNDNIIIEVTPTYRYHFEESKGKKDFIQFSDFVDGYKPLAKITIDESIIEKWLGTCKEILEIININD